MKISPIFLILSVLCNIAYATEDNNQLAPIDTKTFVDDSGYSVRNYAGAALAMSLGMTAVHAGDITNTKERLLLANAYYPMSLILNRLGYNLPSASWVAPAGIALATVATYAADRANLVPRTFNQFGYVKTFSPTLQKRIGLGVLTWLGLR